MLFGTNLYNIWCKLSTIIKDNGARTVSSNSAILDKFSEQHQHQCTKISPYSVPNLLHILVRYWLCMSWIQSFATEQQKG